MKGVVWNSVIRQNAQNLDKALWGCSIVGVTQARWRQGSTFYDLYFLPITACLKLLKINYLKCMSYISANHCLALRSKLSSLLKISSCWLCDALCQQKQTYQQKTKQLRRHKTSRWAGWDVDPRLYLAHVTQNTATPQSVVHLGITYCKIPSLINMLVVTDLFLPLVSTARPTDWEGERTIVMLLETFSELQSTASVISLMNSPCQCCSRCTLC